MKLFNQIKNIALFPVKIYKKKRFQKIGQDALIDFITTRKNMPDIYFRLKYGGEFYSYIKSCSNCQDDIVCGKSKNVLCFNNCEDLGRSIYQHEATRERIQK